MAASFKVGDEVEHVNLKGVVWLVLRIREDGISDVQSKATGEMSKFWTKELHPIRRKPEGSLITW